MADGRHYNLSLILVENYSEKGGNFRAGKKQNFKEMYVVIFTYNFKKNILTRFKNIT